MKKQIKIKKDHDQNVWSGTTPLPFCNDFVITKIDGWDKPFLVDIFSTINLKLTLLISRNFLSFEEAIEFIKNGYP